MAKVKYKGKYVPILFSVVILFSFYGCVSVPPEIAVAHSKEMEIIQELQKSHGALIDAYVDLRIKQFDDFYFSEYAEVFLSNWKESFYELAGREYDESVDFQLLYNDLVAEYTEAVKPLEDIRKNLQWAVAQEYRNIYAIHQSVGDWISSIEKLSSAEKEALDSVLKSIDSDLSFDKVDEALLEAINGVKLKLNGIL